jgi:hypothetical protein
LTLSATLAADAGLAICASPIVVGPVKRLNDWIGTPSLSSLSPQIGPCALALDDTWDEVAGDQKEQVHEEG